LSEGIAEAATNGLSVITVGNGVYAESGMLIDFDLTIEADVGAIPVIDAGGVDRHFVIAGTQASPLGGVRLEGLTLQNGFLSNGQGGAINASFVDDLTIADVSLTNNIATDGGAISASGANVTIRQSEFLDNLASRFGGAIYYAAQDNGTLLTISGTFLKGNAADEGGGVFKLSGDLRSVENGFRDNTAGSQLTFTTGHGGAIKSEGGTTLVQRSTFKGNSAEFVGTGGAIDVSVGANDIEILNSTFFENESPTGDGAALQIGGSSTAVIRFSTFADNATSGAIGYPATITNHGDLDIGGTIIARSVGADCDGTGTFAGSDNRIDNACFGVGGELFPVDFLDTVLANNGGRTQTLTLLNANSNAVDAIPAFVGIPCGPPFDQRRSPRPATGALGACDIGAVEAF